MWTVQIQKAIGILVLIIIGCSSVWTFPAAAKKMIILPPNVDYYGQCKETGQYEVFYEGLGRSLYFHMKSSIERFNNLDEARKKQLRYRALAIVSACCRDNWKIEMFYNRVTGDPEKLQNACEKYQSDIIVWVEFEPGYKEKLIKSLNQGKDCFLGLDLKAYVKGYGIHTMPVVLAYKHQINAFSPESQRAVSGAVFGMLKELYFEQQKDASLKTDNE